MSKELWRNIIEFPIYDISNLGRVYNNKNGIIMRTSHTVFGHTKITLTAFDKSRHTRSVAQLVAEAFVEPPDVLCDHVMVLNGDLYNVAAYNLTWRPRWFAWKYTRQLKKQQPMHYQNLPIINVTEGIKYNSVVEAGMTEGLLFDDIWRSTYTGAQIYPYSNVFEVINRV